MHFQLMHESLARFSESFASFLYGLNMNAFCVDFPEVCNAQSLGLILTIELSRSLTLGKQAPAAESFRHNRPDDDPAPSGTPRAENEGETTFMYGWAVSAY